MLHKVTCGVLGCAAALLAALVPAATAQPLSASSSASTVGSCQLAGTAQFNPGLNTSSRAFKYGFTGSLTGCQSSDSSSPASGKVSAGQVLTEAVTNSVTGATDQVQYQEPIATGSGGCASSTTNGQALVTWADGTTSVLGYSTTGALAVVDLSGSIVPQISLTAVNAAAGDPSTYVVKSSRYQGASSTGTLAFQPPDPTACNSSAGVTTAGISGFVSLNG